MTIYNGDCLEVLRGLPDDSVDSVCTDPPYGLSKEPNISEVLTKWLAGEQYDHGHGGFMGKAWDSFVPHPDVWREVYRVLKPGGYALVFAGTRTQDLMTIALRMAGFEVRDVIEWLYFSGFPKSMDVGKAFDRRKDDYPAIRNVVMFLRESLEKSGKTKAELAELIGSEAAVAHYLAPSKSNAICPTWEAWLMMRQFIGFGDEMDAEVWRLNGRKGKPGDAWDEREKVGEKTAGMGTGKTFGMLQSEGDNANAEKVVDITAPATPLARQWDGWGTALKPAHEPIIVVRKPLIGTVADNVERYGTGGINIDGCRIATEDKIPNVPQPKGGTGEIYGFKNGEGRNGDKFTQHDAGRFPANAITTDDDAFYSPYFNVSPAEVSKKSSKRDRNTTADGRVLDGINVHPTVKSTELMAWLVRLITPPGGTVLDPFAGSGTTLVAAKREGFEFIGIEREAEYVEIIEARTKEPVTV